MPPSSGLVFKAHILLYHSTLGSRVIKNKVRDLGAGEEGAVARCNFLGSVEKRRSLSQGFRAWVVGCRIEG